MQSGKKLLKVGLHEKTFLNVWVSKQQWKKRRSFSHAECATSAQRQPSARGQLGIIGRHHFQCVTWLSSPSPPSLLAFLRLFLSVAPKDISVSLFRRWENKLSSELPAGRIIVARKESLNGKRRNIPWKRYLQINNVCTKKPTRK